MAKNTRTVSVVLKMTDDSEKRRTVQNQLVSLLAELQRSLYRENGGTITLTAKGNPTK